MTDKKFPENVFFFDDEDDAMDFDNDPIKWRKLRKLRDKYEDEKITQTQYIELGRKIEEEAKLKREKEQLRFNNMN